MAVDSIADAFVDIGVRTAEYDSDMKNVENRLGRLGARFEKLGRDLTFKVSAPLIALSTFSIKAASDAEEIASKYNVIFRDISDDADKMAQAFKKDFGLASSTAKDLLGNTADLLTGFGFTQKQALGLSDQVNRLAGDLTSFQNVQGGIRRASEALTKGLLGERESMKLLGIAINENQDDFKKLVQQYMQTGGMTERQAKAQATLTLAIEQSKNAIGDYARTMDSTANSSKRLSESIKEMNALFGELLINVLGIPIQLEKLNEILTEAKRRWEGMNEATRQMIVNIGLFVVAVGPAINVITTLTKVTKGFIALNAASSFAGLSRELGISTGKAFALKSVLVGISALKVGLLAVAVVGVGTIVKSINDANKATKQLDESMKGLPTANFGVMKKAVEEFETEIKKLSGEDRIKAIEDATARLAGAFGDDAKIAIERLNELRNVIDEVENDARGQAIESLMEKTGRIAFEEAEITREMERQTEAIKKREREALDRLNNLKVSKQTEESITREKNRQKKLMEEQNRIKFGTFGPEDLIKQLQREIFEPTRRAGKVEDFGGGETERERAAREGLTLTTGEALLKEINKNTEDTAEKADEQATAATEQKELAKDTVSTLEEIRDDIKVISRKKTSPFG